MSDVDDRPLQAWTYVVRSEDRAVLTDEHWDRGLFELLHLHAFLRKLTG